MDRIARRRKAIGRCRWGGARDWGGTRDWGGADRCTRSVSTATARVSDDGMTRNEVITEVMIKVVRNSASQR